MLAKRSHGAGTRQQGPRNRRPLRRGSKDHNPKGYARAMERKAALRGSTRARWPIGWLRQPVFRHLVKPDGRAPAISSPRIDPFQTTRALSRAPGVLREQVIREQ